MKKFKIALENDTLTIELEGKFDKENADSFTQEFKETLKNVQPEKCELIINAGKLHVASPDLHESLKNCFRLYEKIGFKKITILLENNVILGMQAKRLAGEAGLSNFEIKYD